MGTFTSSRTHYPTTFRLTLLLFLFFTSSIGFQSCAPSLYFDSLAYNTTQSLKEKALNMMSKATEPYADHKSAVTGLSQRINEHIIYEQERGEKNTKIVEMWELLMDTESNLLGGFFERWRTQAKLSPAFVEEAKTIVSNNFDKILNLENSRKRQKISN